MKKTCFLVVATLFAPLANAHDGHDESGSYWAIYLNGTAADSCLSLGDMVDESCCTEADIKTEPIVESFSESCFVIEGLLEGGESLQSYLGCDGDSNTPTYGEACYSGTPSGIIPVNTTVVSSDTATIEECGCTFQVTGNGCHKIRDFSSLPGYEADPRQVFLFMDETCGTSNAAKRLGSFLLGLICTMTTAVVALI